MADSYPDDDQPPAVSASTLAGSGSEEEKGTMTREERLAKAARHTVWLPLRAEPKEAESRSFEEIVATPLLRQPVRLSEVLECRGKSYFERS